MDNKIKRIPIKPSQIKKNSLGPLYVVCQVSQRYLQLHPDSGYCPDGGYIPVDVITEPDDDNPGKLCPLILTRNDLPEALKNISCKDQSQ